AEGVRARRREAQVAAVCELFDQPYLFSDPLTLAASLDKAIAKRLIRDAGIPTTDFAVARWNASELSDWDKYPAFVKPIAEGTSKGCSADSLVHDPFTLRERVTRRWDHYRQPVLV